MHEQRAHGPLHDTHKTVALSMLALSWMITFYSKTILFRHALYNSSCLFAESTHYELLQQAMTDGLLVPLKFLKFVFFGPPGAGKTTFMRRLVGEIARIDPDYVQPSTLTADQKELMIKVCLNDSSRNETLVINPTSEWCSVTNKEGKCSLNEEAMIIYHFVNDIKLQPHADNLATSTHAQPNNVTNASQLSTESDTLSEGKDPMHNSQKIESKDIILPGFREECEEILDA